MRGWENGESIVQLSQKHSYQFMANDYSSSKAFNLIIIEIHSVPSSSRPLRAKLPMAACIPGKTHPLDRPVLLATSAVALVVLFEQLFHALHFLLRPRRRPPFEARSCEAGDAQLRLHASDIVIRQRGGERHHRETGAKQEVNPREYHERPQRRDWDAGNDLGRRRHGRGARDGIEGPGAVGQSDLAVCCGEV
jgi:hypothetical protein